METFFGNIFGIILIIITFLGFILFLQFISKTTGKNIKQKYGSSIIRPNDFDESKTLIKKGKDHLNFKLKTLGLSKFEKIILKFEKILDNSSRYKYSIYLSKIKQYSILKEKSNLIEENFNNALRGIKSETVSIRFDQYMSEKEKIQMSRLGSELSFFLNHFENTDIEKIVNFIGPVLENDNDKILLFLDLLGCENFKHFNEIINELQKSFLKNEISKQEIDNIKKLILSNKGLIEIII